MHSTKFQFIWPNGFRGEESKKISLSTLYRGPPIDASYQVSVYLAEGFQKRRLKCEKLTDDGRRAPSDGKSSHCLWQGELTKYILILKGVKILKFYILRRHIYQVNKNVDIKVRHTTFFWNNLCQVRSVSIII